MRLLATLLAAAIAIVPVSANACPIVHTCVPPQPILAAIVAASADDLFSMSNVALAEASMCDEWADELSPSVWYGLAAFSWGSSGSIARRFVRALEARREAAEMRAHAARYRERAILLRERSARLRDLVAWR